MVLRNVFDPSEFDEDAARILEYSGRLREHCAKFGRVTKVVLYDKHVEGVAQVSDWFSRNMCGNITQPICIFTQSKCMFTQPMC